MLFLNCFRRAAIGGVLLALLVGLGRAVEPEYVAPFQGVVFSAPAATTYCRIDPQGITVLPNGRLLTPRGRQLVSSRTRTAWRCRGTVAR